MGPVEASRFLEQLEQAVEQHTAAIMAAAREAPSGDRWRAFVAHYRVAEAPPEARAFSLPRGAPPDEVDRVLGAIAGWAQGELTKVGGVAAMLPNFVRLSVRVQSLVAVEGGRHRAAVTAPQGPAPAVGSIFANAQATASQTPWAAQYYQGAQANTLTCVHCGSAQERPLDFRCRYCGKPMAG